MTLAEFRRLTAHLAGERELLCAGAGTNIGDDGVVLWPDCPERSGGGDDPFPAHRDETMPSTHPRVRAGGRARKALCQT